MGRLVADLLDSSTLDAGVLRLQTALVRPRLVILEAAVACVPSGGAVACRRRLRPGRPDLG